VKRYSGYPNIQLSKFGVCKGIATILELSEVEEEGRLIVVEISTPIKTSGAAA
jgi:hypothetical protein